MTMMPTYFPSPPQGVWHLGPLPIRAYALFIIIGIVVALLIGDRRWEARGGQRGVIYDIALWAVPFGLVGGRLYHLATDWRTYFGPGGAGLGAALRIWDGGLGIWGAVALGGVGAWIGCRRRGIPLPAFADAIAPGIILAQAIGRLGNYFNQELYGRETTLPWGLEIFYRRDPAGYIDPHSLDGVSTGQLALVVQPTFLYELIWDVLVFVALIYLDRRFTLGHGRLFAIYVAGYCVGRFCVELLRDDTATHIAGIRINSFTSTFVFIGAVVYIILAPKGREDPESLRGTDYVAEETPEPEPEPEPADELATVASVSAATAAAAGTAADDTAETAESAQVADSDTVKAPAEEPETAKAEVTEPEVEEPEVAECEVADAEAEEREVESEAAEAVEPAIAEPEVAGLRPLWRRLKRRGPRPRKGAEPEAEELEVEPEAVEVSQTEAAEAEAEEPQVESETGESDAVESEIAEPEVAAAEAAVAEAVEAGAAEPEAAETEAVATEAAEAEVAEPEAEQLEAGPETAEVAETEVAAAEGEESGVDAEAAETEAGEADAEQPQAESESAEPEVAAGEAVEGKVSSESDVDAADRADQSEAEPDAKPDADAEKAAAEPPADDDTAPPGPGTADSIRRRLILRLRSRMGR